MSPLKILQPLFWILITKPQFEAVGTNRIYGTVKPHPDKMNDITWKTITRTGLQKERIKHPYDELVYISLSFFGG